MSSRFASLDVNADGYVTKREYIASGKTEPRRQMSEPQSRPMPPEPRDPY